MADLFTIENKIKIIELKASDIIKETDIYRLTFDLLKSHEQNYPDIERWFKSKVIPGIQQEERAVYLGLNNDKLMATAVVKKGIDSKFCHLHIEEQMRHQNIGDVFFILMSIYVRRFAQRVHFSLPEGLWEEKKKFFNSFGFTGIKKYQTQYRKSEEELTSTVDFKILWNNILNKIPDLIEQFAPHPDSPLNGIVMSIRPNFSRQIMNGEKIIEIRKKFNKKWKNHIITIYSSKPVQELLGYATIKDVVEEKPETLWSYYSDKLGCSKSEFEDYTKGSEKVFAIFISDIKKFHNNLSLNYLSDFFNKSIYPPQSYSSVNNTDWKNIISVAELLHGRYNVFSQAY